MKSLMVVYDKDYEVCATAIKVFVEKKDDKKDGEKVIIVGTEDGTVEVGSMTDKQYVDSKSSFPSKQKILFIGDVSEKRNLEPIMDILYNKYGIKIGCAGNMMLVTTDVKALIMPDSYEVFLTEFRKRSDSPTAKKERLKKGWNWRVALGVLMGGLGPGAFVVGAGAGAGTGILLNCLDVMREQQRVFAMLELYMNHLEKFMKA